MPDNANHAIRDGDLRLVYIAGDLGLYKLFVDTGEVAMMHPVSGGERGYMVGYGALTRREVPKPVDVELVLTPAKPTGYGYTDPKYVFRHYTAATGWQYKPVPAPGIPWAGVRVNKSDKNKWVTWSTDGTLEANVRLYVSSDAGWTWTQVVLDSPTAYIGISNAMWSPHAADFLWVAAQPQGSPGTTENRVSAYYGNPFTAMSHVPIETHGTRHGKWLATNVMHDGTFYGQYERGGSLDRNSRKAAIDATGGILYNNAHTGIYIPVGTAIVNVGISTAVYAFTNGAQNTETKNAFRQDNYLIGDLVDTGLTTRTTQATSLITGRVFLGGSLTNGVREVLNPLTSPSTVTVYGEGMRTYAIGSDAQSGMVVAAMHRSGPNLVFLVSNGGDDWEEFVADPAFVDGTWVRSDTLEVVTG